ncbi:MAG: hypothetical protein V1492_05820, partial [Candidatus Micrarchaeota archaeon]
MSSYGQVATGIGRSAFAQTDAFERQQNELSTLIEFLSAPKYAKSLEDGIPFKTTVKVVAKEIMPKLKAAGFTASETQLISPDKKTFALKNGKFNGEALDWLADIYSERSRQSAIDSAIARQPVAVVQAPPQPIVSIPVKNVVKPPEEAKPKEPEAAKPKEAEPAKPVVAPKPAEPAAPIVTTAKKAEPVVKEQITLQTANILLPFTFSEKIINNYLLVLQDVTRNASVSRKGISQVDELDIRYTSLKPKKGIIETVPILYQNYLTQLAKKKDADAEKSLAKLRKLMPWINQDEEITGALKDKLLNDAKALHAVVAYTDFFKNPSKYKASQKADLEKELVPSLKAIANMVLSPTEKEAFLEALDLGTKKGIANAIKIIKDNMDTITNLQIAGFDFYAKQENVAGEPAKALLASWLKINPLSGRGVRLAALEQYDFESKYIIQNEYLSTDAYNDAQKRMNPTQKSSIEKAAEIEAFRVRLLNGEAKKALDPKKELGEAIKLVKGVPGLEKINAYLTVENVGKLKGDKMVLTYTLLSIAEAQLLHNSKNGGAVKEDETSHLHWAKTFFPKIFVPGSQGYNENAEQKVALFFANRSIEKLMPYHASMVQRYV